MFQYLLCFLVREAAVAADDRLGKVPFLHLCLLVHDEDDAVGQLVLVGAQGTDVVAQAFGKHGDGAVDEVDAGAALLCLAVDDTAFGNVVRHVGNVHTHLVQLPLRL